MIIVLYNLKDAAEVFTKESAQYVEERLQRVYGMKNAHPQSGPSFW